MVASASLNLHPIPIKLSPVSRRQISLFPTGTRLWYRQTRHNLVEFFGAEKPLHDITEGDAEDWRLHLVGKDYAEATIGRRCKYAKQFLSAAVRKRLIPANPFVALKGGTQENKSRHYFVTQQAAST